AKWRALCRARVPSLPSRVPSATRTPRPGPRRRRRSGDRPRPRQSRRCWGGSTTRPRPCASRSSPRSLASATRAPSFPSWARSKTRRPTFVRRACGDLGDPRASSALVLALRDQSTDVRRDALAALGRMRAADAVDAIAPFVADSTPPLRQAALTALGRIATPDAVGLLVGALGAGDDAAGALEPTPAREALVASSTAAVPSLITLLGGSPSPQQATSAAWVLGALRAHDAAPAIVLAMRRGTLPTAAALHALAGAGTGAHVPVVLEFVVDRNQIVRGEALAAALALLDPAVPDGRAVEPLAAALRDARPTLVERARIATLLGRTGAPRAAPLLVELTRARD